MLNPSSIGHTMGLIDNLPKQETKANTGQIQHLTPARGLQGSQSRAKFMQSQIDNAAHHPSTSKNLRYNSLLALKGRDYQNAPGSEISLTADGLLGGTREEAIRWRQNLSEADQKLFNRYKSDSSLLTSEELVQAKKLDSEYGRIYRSQGKHFRGEGSSSRPTTGQLGLTESDLKKRADQEAWRRSQNPDE